jgi:diguanylate cyclase (GGDEF)-like protein
VILARDLTTAQPSDEGDVHDAVRGLAGVPIVSNGEVLGAICVFDTKPLQVDERTLAALKSLGQVTFDGARVVLPAIPVAHFRDRASDRNEAGRPHDDAGGRPYVVDWPPSMLERSGGEFAVARELARARREGHQLSVVLFDFTSVEHSDSSVNDETLETVTQTLLRAIRQSDLPIRWNGNELLVVLPGLADGQARTVAERVRAALHAGAGHRVAVSGGVAELKADERFGDVVERARQKVAMARGRGHNRIV